MATLHPWAYDPCLAEGKVSSRATALHKKAFFGIQTASLQPGGMAGQRGNSVTGAGSHHCPSIPTTLPGRRADSPSGGQSAGGRPPPWPVNTITHSPRPGRAGCQPPHGSHRGGLATTTGTNKSPVCAWPFEGGQNPQRGFLEASQRPAPLFSKTLCPELPAEAEHWALCRPREGKGGGFWRKKHLWPLPHASQVLPDHVPQPDGLVSLCQELPRLGITRASSARRYRRCWQCLAPVSSARVLEPRSQPRAGQVGLEGSLPLTAADALWNYSAVDAKGFRKVQGQVGRGFSPLLRVQMPLPRAGGGLEEL